MNDYITRIELRIAKQVHANNVAVLEGFRRSGAPQQIIDMVKRSVERSRLEVNNLRGRLAGLPELLPRCEYAVRERALLS